MLKGYNFYRLLACQPATLCTVHEVQDCYPGLVGAHDLHFHCNASLLTEFEKEYKQH